jgi:hypothetical protein
VQGGFIPANIKEKEACVRYLTALVFSCFLLPAQRNTPVPGSVPGSAPEQKCSIEGTVVNALTGEPLKKVHLTLRPLDQQNALPYGANTDAAGHFLMDELDPGRYSFSASRNGFLGQSYSPDGIMRRVTPLTLAKGQALKQLVFKLTPQGVISGRVLDEDGEPLADVSVQPMVFQYLRGRRQLIAAGGTSTNDLGEFRLHNLGPGKYILSASRNQRNMMVAQERIVGSAQAVAPADEGYVTTYHPSAISPSNANEVEITPGAQVSGINITLARTRTVRIKGHVDLPAGKSQRGVNISLMPLESVGSGIPFPKSIDAKGNFEMRGVTAGSYWLRANYDVDGKFFSGRVPLEVGNSNMEGIELTLQAPLEVAGHVVIEGNAELNGGTIYVNFRQKSAPGGPGTQVKNDLTFRIANMERDTYDVSVYGLSQDFYLKSIRAEQQDMTETGVDLTEGAPEDLTVTVSPYGGAIDGSVQNAKDEPAVGVLVTLIPDASHRSTLSLFKTANTDQNGHFTIRGVRPGEYKLFAWEMVESGAYQDPDFLKPYESAGEAVSVKERSHETVQLKLIPAQQ